MTTITSTYTAKDIEVLEGLEPVRKRPGMYIGGTDQAALEHLVLEVFDNAMDEVVAGFAKIIEVHLDKNNKVTIKDNGRGIPIDPHPKFKDKSALEVIMTTLHSGGKFNDKVYATSGGLHGVGISVVNALSDYLEVVVQRDGNEYKQSYSCGYPTSSLEIVKTEVKTTGTSITFHPDSTIFEDNQYKAINLYNIICSKAYLFKGVSIKWSYEANDATLDAAPPKKKVINFPNGLQDYLDSAFTKEQFLMPVHFAGDLQLQDSAKIEWAMNFLLNGQNLHRSYCNTIYTSLGGSHEQGFKNAILKGVKNYADLSNNKKAQVITVEDIQGVSTSLLSVFIKNPIFQGQTKDKLLNQEAQKLVENNIKIQWDDYLTANPKLANAIIDLLIEEAEERLKRKKAKEVSRKNPIKSLRLPGKLADCSRKDKKGTELFLVEGDSAGGSAKQARNMEFQAILPLRGKILNVANSTLDKIHANQEIADLIQALGIGLKDKYKEDDLRYEKVIIMTDADVDGAHITSLLLTFFYQQIPLLIKHGHLYLAQPPLYRIVHNNANIYIKDDKAKNEFLAKHKGKIEIGRFKGLGEMNAIQLKETTMDPKKRTLLQVCLSEDELNNTDNLVSSLMGKNPQFRFKFIQDNASLVEGKLDL